MISYVAAKPSDTGTLVGRVTVGSATNLSPMAMQVLNKKGSLSKDCKADMYKPTQPPLPTSQTYLVNY